VAGTENIEEPGLLAEVKHEVGQSAHQPGDAAGPHPWPGISSSSWARDVSFVSVDERIGVVVWAAG
jgi:hypothetical protein